MIRQVEAIKGGEAIPGVRLEPGPRHRALAAREIARLSELPSDLVVAAVVAGAVILRARGIGPLPILLAMAEAVDTPGKAPVSSPEV